MTDPGAASTLRSKAWLLALVFVSIGLFERRGLDEFWANPDEGIFYEVATTQDRQQAIDEVLSNAHPPLIYLVLRSFAVVSEDIAWLRMPSLLAGLVVIFGMFLLGREVGGNLCGLLAALGMVWLPELVVQSMLLRPYMLQMAFLVFALWFLMRSLRDTSRTNVTLYSVCISLAALTHYSTFIVLGGIGLALLSQLARRKFSSSQALALAMAHIAPLLIGLALYQFHLKAHVVGGSVADQAQGATGWMNPYFVAGPIQAWHALIGLMAMLFGYSLSGPAGLLFLSGLVWMSRWRKPGPQGVLPSLVIGIIACALLFSAMRQYGFGATRHSIYLAPIVVLVLAASLAGLLRLGAGPTVGGIAGILFLLPLGPTITNLISAEEQQVNPEQLTLTADMTRFRERILEPLKKSESVMMMNLQSFYVLLPCLRGAQLHRKWGRDFFAIPWGRSRLLVNMAWTMTAGSTGLDKNSHLLSFIGRIEERFPELRIRERSDAWMFSSGWITPLADGLIRADEQQPEGQKLLRTEGSIRGAGVKAFQWDMKTYLAVVAHALNDK